MASNDKDNYAFDRRDVITPCLNYQTPGSSSSAWQSGQIGSLAMAMVPTESSIQGTCLQTVKCSLPNNSFFSPSNNWETATGMDKTPPFLSTAMVSASQGTMPFPNACETSNMSDAVIIREMIGRLGGHYSSSQTLRASGLDRVLNMGWNAPENPPKGGNFIQGGGSTVLSPHHGLAEFPSDAGFGDRDARFSGFGVGTSFNHTEGMSPSYSISGCTRHPVDNSGLTKISRLSGIQPPKNEPNMVEVINASSSSKEEVGVAETGPRAAETKAGRLSRSSTPGVGTSGNESDEAELSTGHEESSSSDQFTGEAASGALHARKRKKKDKAEDLPSLVVSHVGRDTKSAETDELKGVKYKVAEGMKDKGDLKSKAEQSSSANTGEGSPNQAKHNAQNSEAPKEDYIHVRARRGQATNSHSLAERVRREKISERMKFLQDLVPGCSKVTGKAVMLDEIINYVQSLQRQVEFLSMKLATVNPRLDFNLEGLLAKDMLQSRGSTPTMGFVPDANASYPQIHHPQQGPIQVGAEGHNVGSPIEALRRTMNAQLASIDGYGDAISQVSNVWDDELQSVVQMGFTQNTQAPLTSQGLNGSVPVTHMKVEL